MVYKLRKFTCLECEITDTRRARPAQKFCSIKCRQQFLNSDANNPAKSKEARKKISKARKGKPTTLGRTLPDVQKRAISKSLTGRKHTQSHKDAISKGLDKARKEGRLGPKNPNPLKGKDHPNWKGGKTPQRQKEYNTKEYKAFINIVLRRDNFTCQECGARNGNGKTIKFEVHHIKSYAEYPTLRLDPDNGIVLCIDCHNETKRGKPRPKRKDIIRSTPS